MSYYKMTNNSFKRSIFLTNRRKKNTKQKTKLTQNPHLSNKKTKVQRELSSENKSRADS